MPKATNQATPSRRVFLGTAMIGLLAGTGATSATPFAAGDVCLLGLADELAELQSQTEALNNCPEPNGLDAAMDRVLDAYWKVADEIAATPPTSAEGIRAHARALRSVIWQIGQEKNSIADHTEALIRAVLGGGLSHGQAHLAHAGRAFVSNDLPAWGCSHERASHHSPRLDRHRG